MDFEEQTDGKREGEMQRKEEGREERGEGRDRGRDSGQKGEGMNKKHFQAESMPWCFSFRNHINGRKSLMPVQI